MATLISDLWSEHRSRLRGYIAKRVRENDAVDDILQVLRQRVVSASHYALRGVSKIWPGRIMVISARG